MAVRATMTDVKAANRRYHDHCQEHKCPQWIKLQDARSSEPLCSERVFLLNEARRIGALWNEPDGG